MTNTYVLVHLEMYTYQLACPNTWWEVQWNLSLPESADQAVTLLPWLCEKLPRCHLYRPITSWTIYSLVSLLP